MLNSDLFQLLSSLSLEEINDWESFFRSSIKVHKNPDLAIIEFYDLFKKIYLVKKENMKSDIFWELFRPEKEYNDTYLRNLRSRTLKILVNFFIDQELQSEPLLKRKLFLSNLGKRGVGLSKHFYTEANEILEFLKETPGIDTTEQQAEIFLIKTRIRDFESRYSDRTNKSLTPIAEIMIPLEKYFQYSVLRMLCITLNEDQIRSTTQFQPEWEEFIYLFEKRHSNDPVIKSYLKILYLLKGEERIADLESILDEIQTGFPHHGEQLLMLTLLTNSLSRKIKLGEYFDSAFLSKIYETVLTLHLRSGSPISVHKILLLAESKAQLFYSFPISTQNFLEQEYLNLIADLETYSSNIHSSSVPAEFAKQLNLAVIEYFYCDRIISGTEFDKLPFSILTPLKTSLKVRLFFLLKNWKKGVKDHVWRIKARIFTVIIYSILEPELEDLDIEGISKLVFRKGSNNEVSVTHLLRQVKQFIQTNKELSELQKTPFLNFLKGFQWIYDIFDPYVLDKKRFVKAKKLKRYLLDHPVYYRYYLNRKLESACIRYNLCFD